MTCTDITKTFESILQKARKEKGEIKDILRSRKKTEYRKKSGLITKKICELEARLGSVSSEDNTFMDTIHEVSVKLGDLNAIKPLLSNESSKNHRNIIHKALEARIKSVVDKYGKKVRNDKNKSRLAKRKVHKPTIPIESEFIVLIFFKCRIFGTFLFLCFSRKFYHRKSNSARRRGIFSRSYDD